MKRDSLKELIGRAYRLLAMHTESNEGSCCGVNAPSGETAPDTLPPEENSIDPLAREGSLPSDRQRGGRVGGDIHPPQPSSFGGFSLTEWGWCSR